MASPVGQRDLLTPAPPSNCMLFPTLALIAAAALPQDGPTLVPIAMTGPELAEAHRRAGQNAWADGERLVVCRRLDGEALVLVAGDLHPLAQVPNSDLWALCLRIPDLDRMVLSYAFYRPNSQGLENIDGGHQSVFRGGKAVAAAESKPVSPDRLLDVPLESEALGCIRSLRVYLPPGHDPRERYPVIYMADGGGDLFAACLEAMIDAGMMRPTLLVGIPHADGVPDAGGRDARSRDYLCGLDEKAFESHETLFVEEARRYAETQLGASLASKERLVAGCSNGASLALSLARRHPQLYGHVIALSFGWGSELEAWEALEQRTSARVHLAAGKLEPAFLEASSALAKLLESKGAAVQFTERFSGHDAAMWRDEFARACGRSFPVEDAAGK